MATKRAAILADLVSAVGAISGLTGGAKRPEKDGVDTTVKPCAVVQWVQDSHQDGPTTNYATRILTAAVYLFFKVSDTPSMEQQAEEWLARLEAAVMADRSRGGYARDTILKDTIPFPVVEGQPDVGGLVTVEITYITDSLGP